jgi:acid stress-induced BolA-like protein IbaG/YrbA
VALRIMSEPSDVVAERLRESIEKAIPDARVSVETGGAGHFALAVVSVAFDGKSRVAQQQLVYGAIAHLMKGDAAPVHAIDRLTTSTP